MEENEPQATPASAPSTAFTPETAREAAKRSAEVRARNAGKTPAERAHDAIAADMASLTRELLDAAHGRGAFASLNPKDRLSAVVRALEWELGRPASKKAPETPDDPGETPPEAPDDLFT